MVKPHRVPESVFEVEFKLFDFMTIKQFVIVAVTCTLAVGFYFLLDKVVSPFIKWLVVSFIGMFGLIAAFVKVQGEPFEVYVTNFILALISPQRRVWEKKSEIPLYLKEAPSPTTSIAKQAETMIKKAKKVPPLIEETQQFPVETINKLDVIEQQYLEGRLPIYGSMRSQDESRVSISSSAYRGQRGKAVPQAFSTDHVPSHSIDPTVIPGVIWGLVKDMDGHLVGGATVQILNSYGVPVSALTTNQLGQFRTGGVLPEGDYYVRVSYKDVKYKVLPVRVSKMVLPPLTFTPIPEGGLPGGVATQASPPQPQSTPQLSTSYNSRQLVQPSSQSSQQVFSTTTKSMEENKQTQIQKGFSAVSNSKTVGSQLYGSVVDNLVDIDTLSKSTTFVEGNTGVPLSSTFKGEVFDENENPLLDVEVIIKTKEGTIVASTVTDRLGRFSFNGSLQNGEYVVELVKDGYWFNKYYLKLVGGGRLEPRRFIGKRN